MQSDQIDKSELNSILNIFDSDEISEREMAVNAWNTGEEHCIEKLQKALKNSFDKFLVTYVAARQDRARGEPTTPVESNYNKFFRQLEENRIKVINAENQTDGTLLSKLEKVTVKMLPTVCFLSACAILVISNLDWIYSVLPEGYGGYTDEDRVNQFEKPLLKALRGRVSDEARLLFEGDLTRDGESSDPYLHATRPSSSDPGYASASKRRAAGGRRPEICTKTTQSGGRTGNHGALGGTLVYANVGWVGFPAKDQTVTQNAAF